MDCPSTTGDCIGSSVIPHLALRAAKKLNPKLQCWRWNDSFMANFTCEPGCWVPVGTPKWLPYCIYAVTSLSLLSLRYLEDEANDRGLNHETSEPF